MIIGSGAEAIIERDGNVVKKIRKEKSYRHPDLDMKLRKSRTRREAKVLEKLSAVAPALIAVDDDEMTIDMAFVDSPQLRDVLNKENAHDWAKKVGVMVRSIHDLGIIHGDLTSSNVLATTNPTPIDFGLSFFSDHIEDKAVDLHVLKEALSAKHPDIDFWSIFESAYGDTEVLDRLRVVESRGRYKKKG